ncbi:hypothetical protein L249_3249 [Ophiocordyceps polyrhachis-furcata BCC 54312]|uniref:Uncharacterized protein n=1 Tax=Ophiocordyceps polyrhachis-furcata BCC 54312 TaxID=1330021 RepID=A0A367LP47_9HYPO|nr:hypothetical protein L249_3249 [Ophiocordyceps polyrhachis-furcata BCC 54312]
MRTTFIDLTGDDEQPPTARSDDPPPAKRQRSDTTPFRQRSFKLVVSPVIDRCVGRTDKVPVQEKPVFVEAKGGGLRANGLFFSKAYSSVVDKADKAAPKAPVAQPQADIKPRPPQPSVTSFNNNIAKYEPRCRTKEPSITNKWFGLKTLPYLPACDRDLIAKGSRQPISWAGEWPIVYHVDFSADEVARILAHLSRVFIVDDLPPTIRCLAALCFRHHVPSLVGQLLPRRNAQDVHNFCSDLKAGRATDPQQARTLSLHKEARGGRSPNDGRLEARQSSRISSLLLAREFEGNAGFGRMRRYENFQNELNKAREDSLAVVAEYTNCAGDISTMSWVSDNTVLCGTTAHSDAHNQQYNKPGNLVLGSVAGGVLLALSDHRIPRPRVEKGENATEAMRQSQDPWLYCSVVSSDYDPNRRWAYTSSFDWTVKVWQVSDTTVSCIATWLHGGNVNFVAAARDDSGLVASAADVPSQAVRVYRVRDDDVDASPYQAVSCTRTDADGSASWAYFPATMQWGRAPGSTKLLAVGYSPRGRTGDHDIPEEKRNTGEIMLWDAERGHRVPVLTATTSNVFEISWHPTLQRFIAATSRSGPPVESQAVRTQIRIFQRDRDRVDGAYSEFQKLDCTAADINELTVMPNSVRHAYITAGCTDGNVYVWDTAQGDDPIHILRHGYPIDDFSHDREKEDTGVKFTAWGASPDRLYTGSSDGVVSVWNVRNKRDPLVRRLLEAPGPISVGAFSPDHGRLAIGDATGRVFFLSVESRDEHAAHLVSIPGSPDRRVRRPKPLTPHPEPPPPLAPTTVTAAEDGEEITCPSPHSFHSIAAYARRTYLDSGQLRLHANPVIGAVQGANYASTALFRREAHLDENPSAPLLTEYERLQRASIDASGRGGGGGGRRSFLFRRLKEALPPITTPIPSTTDSTDTETINTTTTTSTTEEEHRHRTVRNKALHEANLGRDVEGLRLHAPDVWLSLSAERALLEDDGREDWGFDFEDEGYADGDGFV